MSPCQGFESRVFSLRPGPYDTLAARSGNRRPRSRPGPWPDLASWTPPVRHGRHMIGTDFPVKPSLKEEHRVSPLGADPGIRRRVRRDACDLHSANVDNVGMSSGAIRTDSGTKTAPTSCWTADIIQIACHWSPRWSAVSASMPKTGHLSSFSASPTNRYDLDERTKFLYCSPPSPGWNGWLRCGQAKGCGHIIWAWPRSSAPC